MLAKGPLNAGPGGVGILFSAYGLGALGGGIIGGAFPVRRRGRVSLSLIAAMGIVFAGIALARTLWQVAALLLVSGAVFSWLGITYVTLIQQRADPAFVGRVMGMLMFGIYGLYPLSYGLAGWASELLGVGALFVGGGAMIVIAGLAGWTVPELRKLD